MRILVCGLFHGSIEVLAEVPNVPDAPSHLIPPGPFRRTIGTTVQSCASLTCLHPPGEIGHKTPCT